MKSYYEYGFENRDKHFICIAGTYQFYNQRENSNYLFLHKDDLCVSVETLRKYLKIVQFWGFHFEWVEENDGFLCSFPPEKYKTDVEFLAVITILRTAVKIALIANYPETLQTDGVINGMFEWKKKYPAFDFFKCFQL